MKKFLVLYKAPLASFEQMMQATPEQQKAGMDAWMAWSQKAGSSIVDMGAPLGKSLRVTPSGASPTACNTITSVHMIRPAQAAVLGPGP